MTCAYFTFTGVPTDKINKIKPLLIKTLSELTTGEIKFDIDMLKDILKNLILKEKSGMETSPHDTIADNIIGDVLYGYKCDDVSVNIILSFFISCLSYNLLNAVIA